MSFGSDGVGIPHVTYARKQRTHLYFLSLSLSLSLSPLLPPPKGDPSCSHYYYYNNETGETQWEEPPESDGGIAWADGNRAGQDADKLVAMAKSKAFGELNKSDSVNK